eukprot:TRINITY_DN17604_c0_g1_i4.p1 TRINITY_DN17604_c0_g1~~TRINITY_DN17604_c0_g1_i4.p1  ORF type:complete len:130 (-),score=24.44 TRINITY_DN17604_c0_g1_i4:1319-1708(-)
MSIETSQSSFLDHSAAFISSTDIDSGSAVTGKSGYGTTSNCGREQHRIVEVESLVTGQLGMAEVDVEEGTMEVAHIRTLPLKTLPPDQVVRSVIEQDTLLLTVTTEWISHIKEDILHLNLQQWPLHSRS